VIIYIDANGVTVNAVTETHDTTETKGHLYRVLAGLELIDVKFQNGPVKVAGVNGLTNEALLAILIHRTKHLQEKFPCRHNAIAITSMEQALMWFEERTRDRTSRGVEGANAV